VRCPYCTADRDRVVDSRPVEAGAAIRRRRECLACSQRFSTYERAEQPPLLVAKRSGAAEPFDRDKVLVGMSRATKNLAVTPEQIRRAAARVEARVRDLGRRRVSSDEVGQEVLAALRDLDQVAYLRFASVYKGFTSTEDFRRELADLDPEPPPGPLTPPGP
jgi:transcriptional repressor NrdR